MSEKTMRGRVVRALRSRDAISVENPAFPGTPDVNCIDGWIELKWLRSWPVRNGVVSMRHFTPQQRVWLKRRRLRGGSAWLLLQVGRNWLLFDGLVASRILGKATREQLLLQTIKTWENGLNDRELCQCLRS